ncbi:IclR family transcriptional regulator [Streptomyces sp. NPDC015501]|uniref:IclR family transcriptional regulator n=1 Tax=unclassified Streptomyces TaxID=2593676 RepID=UPI0011AB0416|nr:IclR family transcriptional regulator [Streptomyces griseus subsp. griseus]
MALKPEPTAPFHSVQYALRVLEAVSRHGEGVTGAQISRETGLPTGRLAPLLLTLRREGYVEQVGDGAYVVGASLLLLGSGAARRQALEGRLQNALAELRDSIGAAVYLSRYVDGEVSVVQVADEPLTPAVNEWVDFRSSAHASAAGKCLLAQLDHDGRRDHVSRHRTVRLTSRTITDEKVLFAQLDAQAATVPVLDLQEYAVGTVCAAVPLTAGSSAGCLALSLPLADVHRLRAAAETLSRRAAPVLLSLAL